MAPLFDKSDASKSDISEAFLPDDYEEINERYFNRILASRSWNALPAGWRNPHSEAAGMFKLRGISDSEMQHYALDEQGALRDLKEPLTKLLSRWENKDLHHDEFTLCPSVSTANLLALCGLKAAGFETVVFETPAYYASIDQAQMLGFKAIRVPCFREQRFEAHISDFERACFRSSRCVLWSTQPRFGIGSNQCLTRLRELGALVGSHGAMVIDEAAEQNFPSTTSALGPLACPVLRTRGLLKGTGLNGLRISVLMHPPEWRSQFEPLLEVAGASLDRFSLANAASLADSINLLPAMLAQANHQVTNSRHMVELMAIHSWLEPTHLENSYIGSLLLDLRHFPGTYVRKRQALLEYCEVSRMPIVSSASIGFAHDENCEAIRINYFTSEDNVRASADILLQAPPYMLAKLS